MLIRLRYTRVARECFPGPSRAPVFGGWMKVCATILLAGALGVVASNAGAATIISDTFTAPNGTTLAGRTPEIGPPGATYVSQQPSYEHDIQNDKATLGADTGV